MKKFLVVLVLLISIQGFNQSRIYDTFAKVHTEYLGYEKQFDETSIKVSEATDSVNLYITLVDTIQGKIIVQYFTNGRDTNSFCYQTIVYISDKYVTTMANQIKTINKSYYMLDDHNWYTFSKGETLEVKWHYSHEIYFNIFKFYIKDRDNN